MQPPDRDAVLVARSYAVAQPVPLADWPALAAIQTTADITAPPST